MRTPHLVPLLALAAGCLHTGLETTSELPAGPEPVTTTTSTSTSATTAAVDPSESLALNPTLCGDDVASSEVEGWVERRAQSAGCSVGSLEVGTDGSVGFFGGLGRGGGGPRDAEMASAEAAPPPPAAIPSAAPVGGAPVRSRARPKPSPVASRSARRVPVEAARQQPALRAGSTDDNEAFGAFLEFLDTWTDRPGVAGNHVPMDVADRAFIRVHDRAGNPLPGARVRVMDATEKPLWQGTTYGDGEAPFYGDLVGAPDDLLVQAELDGVWATTAWDGEESVQLTLETERVERAVDLDVVFVIDTTGSMADEIARIKSTLLSVTAQVRGLDRPVDLRYGAVLYRDIGDQYLTRHTALTEDVQSFDAILQGIEAGGGGDGPESLNQGLAVAVTEMDWRDEAAKLMFVVADAPPHMDYQGDVPYADAAKQALSEGIRIHTVAASGLDDFGSLVFRQTAQLTRGDFVFIEYGSSAASAADHGVTGPVANNNLDGILFQKIEREVEGWGREPGAVATR